MHSLSTLKLPPFLSNNDSCLVREMGELCSCEQLGDELAHVIHREGCDVGVRVAGGADQVRSHGSPQAAPDEADAAQVVVRSVHQAPQ